jgi:16S rRNA (guanine527-N7)-methyltransferase
MFHVKHEVPALELSSERRRLLDRYEGLLSERAVAGGLISAEDLPRVRERHLEDCLRAASVVHPNDRDSYDLGSGAGLPGVVVAIACPDLGVTLVERRRSRAAFLESVLDELGLSNARVFAGGSEALSTPVDLAFARALAPPRRSWELGEPLLRPAGRLVYFAGIAFDPGTDLPDEVEATIVPSSLAPSGPLVIMARQ